MKIVNGDIFDCDADALLHQVNCRGVMGGGVAKQVKQKYPSVFEWYKLWCDEYKDVAVRLGYQPLLGKIQVCDKNNERPYAIINLFAQDGYGRDKCYTDYNALSSCLRQVNNEFKGKNIAIPYKMSCDRGGWDWDVVLKIIEEELSDCKVTLYKL